MLNLIALLAAGCSDQGFVQKKDVPEPMDVTITGRACDPTADGWLVGGTVYTNRLDADGNAVETITATTDQDGRWTLEGLPPSQVYTIYVQVADQIVDMYNVRVEDVPLTLEEPVCNVSEMVVAVVTGDYDQFDTVLSKLGITKYDYVNGQDGDELSEFMSNPDDLAIYDAVFFAGGHVEEDVIYDSDGSSGPRVEANLSTLQAYVQGGGNLFVSDWSYDLIEAIWPDAIDFLGDDTVHDAAQLGEPTTVDAKVTDDALKGVLGADTVSIQFDLDTWPVVESVGPDTTTYLTSDVPWRDGESQFTQTTAPLAASFQVGSGTVIFSSFRQVANAEDAGLPMIDYLVRKLQSAPVE